MKLKNLWVVAMIIGSLLLLASFSVEAADKTITDGIEDVSSVSFTGETTVITSSPDIEVDNIDLTQATYTKQGIQVILTLQVRGNIENRGKIIDLLGENPLDYNTAEYEFQLTTSEQDYTVSYTNLTGQLTKGDELTNLTSSDFSVVGDTLTVSFSLISAEETIENLSVVSTFIKFNMSGMTGMDTDDLDPSAFVYLSDIAPNPALLVYEAYAANIGSVGETIQFNGSVQPLTGQPPYTYHWDFGDQATSTALNPTHIYTKAGEFTYTFTVTDHAGDSASETGAITISTEGGSNGSSSSPMLLFLAILIIIIVIGVIIIVWIIRR
jgi:hypothetical protein